MVGGKAMYATKSQKGIRLAMSTLEGEVGKKVFDQIRSTETNTISKKAAQEMKRKIITAEKK